MAKFRRRLADAVKSTRRKRRAAARGVSLQSERLEQRLALAVSHSTNVGLANDWVVILGDNADNIYMQRVATGEVSPGDTQDPTGFDEQELLYANNSSFLDQGLGTFGEVADIDLYDTLYVTNGSRVNVTNVRHDQFPLRSFPQPPATPWITTFVLSFQNIDATEACAGTISYGGNVWQFTNDVVANSDLPDDVYPNNVFTITGPGYPTPGAAVVPTLPIRPVAIAFSDSGVANGDATVTVTWSGFPVVAPGVLPPTLTISYDSNDAPRAIGFDGGGNPLYTARNQNFQIDANLQPSAGPIASFTLPVTNVHPGGIVNGTLTGFLDVTGDGVADFRFSPAQIFGPLESELVFVNLNTGAGPALTGTFTTADNDSDIRTVQGDYNPLTGRVFIRFFNGANPQAVNGPVTIVSATYANYAQDPLASAAVFAPGLTIHNEVYVDLLTSGSSINVESPIIHNAQDSGMGVGADIDLRATNINVSASLSAFDEIRIGPSEASFPAIAQARALALVGSDGTIVDIVIPPGRGGEGYNELVLPVTVTIAPPARGGGRQATASAIVEAGVIIGFQITDPGAGYLPFDPADPANTQPPVVTISAPPAQPPVPALMVAPPGVSPGTAQGFAVMAQDEEAFSVTSVAVPPGLGGQGYDPFRPPVVTIAAPPGGGQRAEAVPIIEYGVVVGILVTNPGSGYTAIPAVTIAPPPDMPPIGRGFIDIETDEYPVPRPTGVAPVAEVVTIDASVAAQFFDIRLGDDPNTPAIPRGRLFVSASGSLSGALPEAPGVVTTTAQRVFVQAANADVLVEGQIFANEHSYLLQSTQADDPLPGDGLEPEHTPFVFSTRSPATGSQTGVIRGGVVAITLGNDAPTAEVGAVAINVVDLQTRAVSLRVTAATREGEPLTGPFPYDLIINEVDDVTVDAVAASGRPITLSAGGSIRFNAALATGSDLAIRAAGDFTTTSPVSSTRGQINIEGTSVTVANSIRVLDPIYDPARDDITLHATAGDINLVGLVSAVNNVNLIQDNTTGPRVYSASTPGGLAIGDRITVEQPLVITDDYTFTDLNVLVNIAHTFVGDLVIELVAPDGTIVTLFNRNGGGGANLVGTVFDSEAATPIDAGRAPFTGTFQPVQPLTPLYGRSTRGTWRLRITDAATADTGTLLNFGITFNIPGQQYGRVGGPARVVAERLNVESQGAVSLFTNVDRLDGVAAVGFEIDEQDDIAVTSLRSGGLVRLVANGVDPGLDNVYTDNAYALIASLTDVTNLEVSTPKGSTEVVVDASGTLVLGRAGAIADGTAAAMQASGNVLIRAVATDIDVLDAPLAGAPQLAVRVATTGHLAATYSQNVPGTRASTLRARTLGSLNASGIDGVTNLAVGDRILVKHQNKASQNGIYVVTKLGSNSLPWVLTRAGDVDTTAELPANTRVRVRDGGQAGGVYEIGYTDTLGVVPIVTALVPNRPGSVLVRAATATSLFGAYDNSTGAIEATSNGVLPLIDGVALAQGDRVLVRQGTHTAIDPATLLPTNPTRVSNGVYRVDVIGDASTPWRLQRVAMDGADADASTSPPALLGFVNVREGVLSTANAGGVYRVAFDSLGVSPMSVESTASSMIIGSDRRESLVTFVVSSNAGANAAAGSLGKHIALRQSNALERVVDGDLAGTQAMDFRFSTLVAAPIVLTQQLPQITEAFTIDGGRRYTPAGTTTATTSRVVVNGGRITRDRNDRTLFTGTLAVGRPDADTITIPVGYMRFSEIRTGMSVNGNFIKAGSRVVGIDPATRRLTLTAGAVVEGGPSASPISVTISNEINGFEFGAGSGAEESGQGRILGSGAVLSNVTVGGFANGAAVTIRDARGVLVRDSVFGEALNGDRMPTRYGVVVGGSADMVTLLNNKIVGASAAGVRIEGAATGVVMVGNRIGSSTLPNTRGVEVVSSGMNQIGVDPITANRAIPAAIAARDAVANTITLPASYTTIGELAVGVGVKGSGVAVGARIAAIDFASRVITLTEGGVIASGSGQVTFGHFVNTVEFGTSLALPLGVNMANLYLGQGVSAAGIRSGSRIIAIDSVIRTIILSAPMTATATDVAITFAAPPRNQIAFNRYGVVLAAGTQTVANSDIFSSTFDGVRITGGRHTVGTSKTASVRSNAIHSNGGYGVNVVPPALAADQTVQGNYLGTRNPGTTRLANRSGNVNPIVIAWTPDRVTNIDPAGNVHGPGRRPGTPGNPGGAPVNRPWPFPL